MNPRDYPLRVLLVVCAAAVIAAGCAQGPQSTVKPNWPVPEGVKTIVVNGYPMAYEDARTGAPLVQELPRHQR